MNKTSILTAFDDQISVSVKVLAEDFKYKASSASYGKQHDCPYKDTKYAIRRSLFIPLNFVFLISEFTIEHSLNLVLNLLEVPTLAKYRLCITLNTPLKAFPCSKAFRFPLKAQLYFEKKSKEEEINRFS